MENKYAPYPKPKPVVADGEFIFAAVGIDSDHIYGQCQGLINAGATLKYIYDTDKSRIDKFLSVFPMAKIAKSIDEILKDDEIKLVTSANIPSKRAELGIKTMLANKDYFTDKAPLTTLEQLDEVMKVAASKKRKYGVYYSERIHTEAAIFASQLVEQGAIGKVIQTMGMGPHSMDLGPFPDWFYKREYYGGILCCIGSHQIEQFLHYTGAKSAKIVCAQIDNITQKQHPGFDDFGDCTLLGDNGAYGYFRVDWHSPKGLKSWGDGRLFILGTKGYIELRKYINIAQSISGGHVYMANEDGEFYFDIDGKVGHPFFGEFILDCINRTENSMSQNHIFEAARLGIEAQMLAEKAKGISRVC